MGKSNFDPMMLLVLAFLVLGIVLTISIGNDVLSAEIGIVIAFLMNMIIIYYDNVSKLKNKLREAAAALLFGVFLGMIVS